VLEPAHFEARDLGAAEMEPRPTSLRSGSLDGVWQTLQRERGKIEEREQDVILEALRVSGGVVAQAARALGIARTTLASRIEALGMRGPRKDKPEP
jgi:DNA-binding NtrC family response regulator